MERTGCLQPAEDGDGTWATSTDLLKIEGYDADDEDAELSIFISASSHDPLQS